MARIGCGLCGWGFGWAWPELGVTLGWVGPGLGVTWSRCGQFGAWPKLGVAQVGVALEWAWSILNALTPPHGGMASSRDVAVGGCGCSGRGLFSSTPCGLCWG